MLRSFYRFVALALALAWGPATLCCAMEAAGWEILCSEAGCHATDSGLEAEDGCNPIENGGYQSTVPSITVSPPVACSLLLSLCELCPQLEVPKSSFGLDLARPPAWVPTWQFERRAAAPAHAPDALTA